MVKIEDFLTPGERVVKKQRRIQMGRGAAGMPAGDLYLTNTRLIFIHSKGWSLLSPTPGSAALGKNIEIPLENIKSVEKGFGSVKIHADKKYEFNVTVWKAGDWVTTIQQAINVLRQSPPPTAPPTEAAAPPKVEEGRAAGEKEIIRVKEVIVKVRCPYCQSLYNETLDECPRCGAKR